MAKNKTQTSQHDILDDGNEKINQLFESAEYFFEQYKNIIIGALVGLVLLVAGFWAYKNLVKKPKEQKAMAAILDAQNYFEMDSLNYALKGDGAHLGFEAIAKQYSGTPAGNRANFGAGVCNLKLGKYPEAVKYLEEFDAPEGLLAARKFGCIADAYAEQNQMDKAIENYKKAADAADNELTAPTYLYRAALALEQKGNKKEALELYKKVNKDYPNSQEGMASEIYIAKLETQTF
ncbi:MAG: tetratricopeptide repeat protein [Chitinophagales bacterium]